MVPGSNLGLQIVIYMTCLDSLKRYTCVSLFLGRKQDTFFSFISPFVRGLFKKIRVPSSLMSCGQNNISNQRTVIGCIHPLSAGLLKENLSPKQMLAICQVCGKKQQVHTNIVVFTEGRAEGNTVLPVGEFSGITCMAVNASSPCWGLPQPTCCCLFSQLAAVECSGMISSLVILQGEQGQF